MHLTFRYIKLLNCKVVVNIIKNYLNKMIKILNSIKDDKQYSNDNILICDLIRQINNILNDDRDITNEFLDEVDKDLNYLDQKYEDLFDLNNLFDPIFFELKRENHINYVKKLREENRKKEKNERKVKNNEDEFISHLLFVLNIALLALDTI